DAFDLRVAAQALKVEPQFQFNLFNNIKGALAKSRLFFRMPYETVVSTTSGVPTAYNLSTESVYASSDETLVLRHNVTTRNLTDQKSQETTMAMAPFIKTPELPAPIFGKVRLRFAPEYTRDFKNDENRLVVHGKIEGTISNDPWWGWSIQTFWPVNVEGKEDQKAVELNGLYLWTGSVLPKRLLGEGYFLEGGVWVGKDALQGTTPFPEALALGASVKLKFGTECRWWQ
ncbi:MAG: hypothetical protein ABIH22_02100, partial [Candidatus Margulisiibacteriota bacterium]